MGTGYQRADLSNQISNGNVVDADVLDLEFDAVEAAFNAATGHTHDGTTAEGGPITKTGPSQDFTHNASWLEPKTTNTIDIGSTSKRFKDGWFQGALTAAGGFIGNLVGSVTGNASTATTLQTARTINGVSFNGSANIEINTNQALTAGDGLSSSGTFNGSVARTVAVDSTVVRTTGNQTIGGTKTFSSTIVGSINGNAATVTNGVYTSRSVSTGNGLTGGGTLSIDRTLALTGQALAFHNLGTNGLVARTGSGTVTTRTVTGTAPVTVTNGDGVSGNPTVAVTAASQAEAQTGSNNVNLMTPLRTREAINAVLPLGVILLWSGSVASIPTGWALCNGSNGTPDLRNRFVVGAGNTYAVGDTGGSDTVTLTTNQIPGHTHSLSATADSAGAHTHGMTSGGPFLGLQPGGVGGATGLTYTSPGNTSLDNTTASSGAHTHNVTGTATSTGGGESHENRPPYYALAYIMRVS